MITDRDIRTQVIASLQDEADEFNVEAIVDEIRANYGLVDIEAIETGAYWAIVERHAN
jgi:hypothetical protein